MNIVFLIHGTWGKGESAWYQPNMDSKGFTKHLENSLVKCGIERDSVTFIPFEWSGHNSHAARVAGAKGLSAKLLKMSEENSELMFHFVAHSHGGNVVLKALEIYLNVRPSEISTKIIDTRNTVDLANLFLKEYTEGKFQFKTLPKEVDQLIVELSETLESISSRESKRYRASFLDGSMYDIEKGRLERILAKIYRHVFALPQYHQIGGLVTLGTPFYEKCWKLTRFSHFSNKFTHWISFIPLALVVVYFYSILLNGLFSFSPWGSWTGFNPLNWHGLHFWITGALALFISSSFAAGDQMESPVDTNVYFDEATLPYYLHILGGNKICRVLNIHSNYLDEAYWLLASYPFITGQLGHYLKKVIKPKVWTYATPSKDVGFWHKSPSAIIQRKIKQLQSFLIAIVLLLIYPLRIAVHSMGSFFVEQMLKTKMRSLAYGLPADEFSDNSEISTHSILSKKYFQTETMDITQTLAMSNTTNKSEDYFNFLWNEDDLNNRMSHSTIAKALGVTLNLEQYRQIIALEERAREYYGLVGIRHSMYYANEAVILHMANFLSECIISNNKITKSHSHITKIPRRPF